MRDSRGRWKPGSSGNPKGRPPTSERLRELLDPHKEDLVEILVSRALEGDISALRLCMERLAPPVKERPLIKTDLRLKSCDSETSLTLINKVLEGEISISEAKAIFEFFKAHLKINEADDLLKRIEALEAV